MKLVVQRVKDAKVRVNNETVGEIEEGLLLLIGITHTDSINDINYCAKKVANLRVFEDENQKMNLSVKDIGGKILSISQFTLYGDCKKGNRPSFVEAARPAFAETIYDKFNEVLREEHDLTVETGQFGADMKVDFTNDGPVTIVLESNN
ncbi:D-aminoacyl-tRNA deacylase [Haloplasma contractile]|uniref:D-aminoacyl-tRNA deacylase n=1 Tax=Haloplasma contractile SSD-17B TaxID=1033810 RepID=U2ECG6_9MOLU|nr:D-aminoacyl-tRNA deacylase [Haloplasma contractile]ERJ12743.1 D-tyrosyl-tRNA deacylase protein [Haloplasma contractile SSD-17B]